MDENAERSPNQSLHAYEQLRGAIIACDLVPGSFVSEGQLAERLGLGKAPVRAALARLKQERLVESVPRMGHRISPLTIRDAENILEMRMLVEPHVAAIAAGRLTAPQLRLVEQMGEIFIPGNRRSIDRFLRINRKAKLAMAKLTGNERLVASVASLLDEFERYSRLSFETFDRTREMAEVGARYLDAMRRGDSEDARLQSRLQLERTSAAVMYALSKRDEIQSRQLQM